VRGRRVIERSDRQPVFLSSRSVVRVASHGSGGSEAVTQRGGGRAGKGAGRDGSVTFAGRSSLLSRKRTG
jgi:hypothetical protein